MVEGLCTVEFSVDEFDVSGVGIWWCGWMGFCAHDGRGVESFNVWSGRL